jgi:hypothetical protein
MPKTTIETVGDVREFLTNAMLGIRNGQLTTDKAIAIIKAAQQVNESFYSEVKVKQVARQAGEAVHELGKLPIS